MLNNIAFIEKDELPGEARSDRDGKNINGMSKEALTIEVKTENVQSESHLKGEKALIDKKKLKKRARSNEVSKETLPIKVKTENDAFKRAKIDNYITEEPNIAITKYNLPLTDKRDVRQTPEQKAILDHAIQLTNDKNYGNVIRVIAGAGTGKTTTLELLSAELLKRNQKILYLVYNKEAQREAISRFSNHHNLDCFTTHAAAMKFMSNRKDTTQKPSDDGVLRDKIKSFYKQDIEKYLTSYSPIFRKNAANNEDAAKTKKFLFGNVNLIGFWIFKTLQSWIRTSKRTLERNYYPIDKNQRGHQDRFKFPPGNFYMEKAMDVWERIWRGEFPVSFDCFLKYAQMGNCVVPQYDYIMLDESQDTTECVLDLFVTQQIHGIQKKNVYMVGDAVQCIYSFRGSKAKFIAQYPEPVVDFKLTNRFRFGVEIAKIANLFLFIKENSPQSRLFNSYRLKGVSKSNGVVSRDSLDYPKTIIARGNCTLVTKALELLAEKPDITVEILGGVEKMNKTIKLAVKVYEFYVGIKKDVIFKDYDDFNSFLKSAHDEEKTEFLAVLTLISRFGVATLECLEQFKIMINKKTTNKIYDVCLSTCHQAKGKEFDRIEVLDDFILLKTVSKNKIVGFDLASKVVESEEEFCLQDWGDELNLWYVAVTRAKLEMRLPDNYWILYEFMIETMNVGTVDGAYRLFEKYFKDYHEELVVPGSSKDDTSKLELLKMSLVIKQSKGVGIKSKNFKVKKEQKKKVSVIPKGQTTILNFFQKKEEGPKNKAIQHFQKELD
jgi:superfamily I DNA/RNA helicase